MKRIAFITGASQGIGAAIAHAFAQAGVQVALAARTANTLQQVADEINAAGGAALPVVCDVTQPATIQAALATVQKTWGPVTIVVNNAGMAASHKFLNHDDALWQRVMDLNLNSVYHVTKLALPMLVANSWGRIINIASVASKIGGRYMAAYAASKHAVLGLTRVLALELLPHQITVNAICPGYVDTPMTEGVVAATVARSKLSDTEARALLAQTSPQNRLIAPAEVAQLACFLLTDAAHGITGQAINVDGGAVMF